MQFIQLLLILSLGIVSCKSTKHQTTKVKNEQSSSAQTDPTINKGEVSEKQKNQLNDSIFAQIQRTPCFGRCEIYTLTVYKSGLVRYKGEKWVEKEGIYEATVDPKVLQQLLDYAKEINFFQLEAEYDNEQVTDVPATITSVRNNEGIKTVVNRYNGPKQLGDFEKYFDSLFKNLDWKKKADKTH